MPVVGIRELARQVSRLVGDVESTRRPAIVTRHGRAVAMIVPVDAGAVEDLLLANAPELVQAMREAGDELAAGETRSLSTVLVELEGEAGAVATPTAEAEPTQR